MALRFWMDDYKLAEHMSRSGGLLGTLAKKLIPQLVLICLWQKGHILRATLIVSTNVLA